MSPAIAGSGGHDATWKAALVAVRGFDLPADAAIDVLHVAFNPRCQPPWSRADLAHKVRDAERSAAAVGYLLGDA